MTLLTRDNVDRLAQELYERYRDIEGKRPNKGYDMPTWENMSKFVQASWRERIAIAIMAHEAIRDAEGDTTA